MARPLCSRRHFLHSSAFGLGTLGLAHLLNQDRLLAAPPKPQLEQQQFTLQPRPPHFTGKAKAMISIFLMGGASQLDLYDFKPKLVEYDGKDFPGEVQYDNPVQSSRKVMAPIAKFKKYGQCGMEMSEILPHLGSIADEICVIRSMQTNVNNHVPSLYALNCGKAIGGRATLGAWLTYGLGSVSQNLPAFVALTDNRGLPLLGSEHWTNGPLPSLFQGTVVRPKEPRILNLDPPAQLLGKGQERQLALLQSLNADYNAKHPGENDLSARMASYELAAKMQLSAKEAFDLTRESKETREMYGVDDPVTRDYGSRCLIARRLVERGVRFVQLWNNGQSWDHHGEIRKALPDRVKEIDRPTAALVKDLKRLGLLDSTIVHCGGEMGRLPVIQVPLGDEGMKRVGRDHNTYGFSQWVAGGGFKKGFCWGATDEFSHKAVENIVSPQDWLTTVLHQFGLDIKKLEFKSNNRSVALLDGSAGQVVKGILA
ncbi:MAG: DUF1501 domain-containing protein [Gemmataceae bacterium]